MIYGARSVRGSCETALASLGRLGAQSQRSKDHSRLRVFSDQGAAQGARQTWQEWLTSHPAHQRPPPTPGNSHRRLRPISRSIAGHFTPLREKRCISSYGQQPTQRYQSDSASRMWASPRRADGQTYPLPIEGTGRAAAARQECEKTPLPPVESAGANVIKFRGRQPPNQPLPERATERRAGENRVAISEKHRQSRFPPSRCGCSGTRRVTGITGASAAIGRSPNMRNFWYLTRLCARSPSGHGCAP